MNKDGEDLIRYMKAAYYRLMHPKEYEKRKEELLKHLKTNLTLPAQWFYPMSIKYQAETRFLFREFINKKGHKKCKQTRKKKRK